MPASLHKMLELRAVVTAVLIACLIDAQRLDSGVKFNTLGTNKGLSILTSNDGSYIISVKDVVWLRSAPTYFNANNRTYKTQDGSLQLLKITTSNGTDNIGKFKIWTFHYLIENPNKLETMIYAIIKVYEDLPIIKFVQNFTTTLEGTQGKSEDDICGGFPGFVLDGPQDMLGYLSIGGGQFGYKDLAMGRLFNKSAKINYGVKGGPLTIFDRSGNAIIFSPFNNFMSASFTRDTQNGNSFYGGIMGGVSTIPARHSQTFVMYYATGINKAFDGWGKLLRSNYGKDPSLQKKDLTITHLGYYTDNGAFYYYHTEFNKTYDVTLYDVKNYADRVKIPYRYFQYDSWWYFKGKYDGVKIWKARPDIFPNGFQKVTDKLNLPAAAHNRFWAPDNTYAKQNGGRYEFIVEERVALPLTKKFWLDLFTDAKQWGLVLYEQDWLSTELDDLKALTHNLSLGKEWLTIMGEAANEKGLHIQYCMTYPRHAMKALELSAVTQARVSYDYHPGLDQWKIGITSMFAAALGIAPFKDNFWTTETQPGRNDSSEPNWKLHNIVSTLSTGPVGPSDGIGDTNADVLMKCCTPSGLILKPQFPAQAIDAQIMQAAFEDTGGPEGEVWISYSEFNGLRFANLLGVDFLNGTQYTVYPNDLGIYNEQNSSLFAIPYDDPYGWAEFSSLYGITFTDQFKPNRPALYHISPSFPGWFMTTIYGDLDKWVPMSPQRFKSIVWTNDVINASLHGDPNEAFNMVYMFKSKQGIVRCTLDTHGNGTFIMKNREGYVDCTN